MSYMNYLRRGTDIVAYAYQADLHCPDCIGNMFRGMPTMFRLEFEATEKILDVAASEKGIDRSDADTDDFPSPVFGSDVEGYEHCGTCGDCMGHDRRDCEASDETDD